MRFTDAYEGWDEGRLTQAQAALILGMSERNFRRHIDRYEADGLSGLLDKRLSQISQRKAAVSEVDCVVQLYKSGFAGWNITHFHSKYASEFKGQRSYSWLKSVLQGAGVVKVAKKRGKHRIKRERMPLPGMMLHQDASTHRWVADQAWDLVACFSAHKKAPIRAFTASARPLSATACLLLSTLTGVRITSPRHRPAARSIR
jgi:transposase